MSIASYNSDKIKLQDSITNLYKSVNYNIDDTTQYEAVKDETKRLFERQEVIYRMVGTITVVAVLITFHRISL